MTTRKNRALWVVQGLLAFLFLWAGGMKLTLPIEAMTKQIPLPGSLLRFIGVAEVMGAMGLILPGLLRVRQGLTPLAAGGLGIIMTGATVVTLASGGGAMALMPLVVGLLAGLVVYGRRGPGRPADTFRVERTKSIQAPAEMVFAHINDFRRWGAWSPFEKLDPTMKKVYSGAAEGVGAVYEWAGNRKAGKGRMEIIEATPASEVRIKLDFYKPFEGHNVAEFTLKEGGDSTEVTWAMYGPQRYLAKLMGVFVNMERLVGKEFEAGLDNLKAVAEEQAEMILDEGSVLCN